MTQENHIKSITFGHVRHGLGFIQSFFLSTWLLIVATTASAHSFNESYVYFDVEDRSLTGRIEVTLTDIARLLSGQEEVETAVTQEEVLSRQDEIFGYFEQRMQLFDGESPIPITLNEVEFLRTPVSTFALLQFTALENVEVPTSIRMSYDAVFGDIDPTHRGYALIASNTRNGMEENESYISLIFGPGDGVKDLYLNDEPTAAIALTFLEHGVWHIWLGFDHVLFLITLLLSSVMVLSAGKWSPSESLRGSLKNTVKIVTVFTVAHTITLTLATFSIVTMPIVFVEAVIAASIAVVAIGNLFPRFHTQSWIIVFIFGLFHGFGFANVLEPLGLDPARKALGLVTFNIGVELGQIAIVLLVFPILFAIRKYWAYSFVGLRMGSIALIAVAAFWFVERTSDGLFPDSGDQIAEAL